MLQRWCITVIFCTSATAVVELLETVAMAHHEVASKIGKGDERVTVRERL